MRCQKGPDCPKRFYYKQAKEGPYRPWDRFSWVYLPLLGRAACFVSPHKRGQAKPVLSEKPSQTAKSTPRSRLYAPRMIGMFNTPRKTPPLFQTLCLAVDLAASDQRRTMCVPRRWEPLAPTPPPLFSGAVVDTSIC